jgi:DNA-cytosine methyltransferase
MRYLSIFSGIEAATCAWKPLGWKAVAFAEVEPFPCSVLKYHYPEVPNLGDVTKFKSWDNYETDVLVGGSPCQSFSVAGLRKGLDDPRGNLTLVYLSIAAKYNPEYLVWENVPGIFSDSTLALHSFLDGIEEIGYAIIGLDVLDAQYFGLAQRRRRIFVCAQKVDCLLTKRTIFSGLTVLQCLGEIWLNTLVVLLGQLNQGGESSDSKSIKSKGSLQKRIKLFDLQKDEQVQKLLNCLDVLLELSDKEPEESDLENGKASSQTLKSTVGTRSEESKTKTENTTESKSTEQSWKKILVESFQISSECITSTSTKETIHQEIYTCAKAMLITAEFIQVSQGSSPGFSTAAESCLTGIREYIKYARQASSNLFTGVEWFRRWADYIRQAMPVCQFIGDIRVRSFGKIFPLSESLRRNPAPSREAGKGVARGIEIGPSGGSFVDVNPTLDSRCKDGPIRNQLAGAVCMSTGQASAEIGIGIGTTLNCNHEAPIIVLEDQGGSVMNVNTSGVIGTLRRETHGHEPIICQVVHGTQDPCTSDDTAFALGRNSGQENAVCFAQNSRDELREMDVAGALAAQPGMKQTSYLRQGMAVRRLLPVECERLQGFEPGYTLVTHNGKPAADGPRYKALGNSMAVNCMRWIGDRIQKVEML